MTKGLTNISCWFAALAVLFLTTANFVHAIVLLDDNFNNYTDGNLVGQGDWFATSAEGDQPVQVASGTVVLNQENIEGGEEDVSKLLSRAIGAGEKVYYGFDVSMEQLPDSGTVNQVYFAHMSVSGLGGADTVFAARSFVRAPVGGQSGQGGDFTFGLRTISGSSPILFEIPQFFFDTTYRVVTSYDFDSGDTEMWIDPISMSDPSVSETNPGTIEDDYSQFMLDAVNFRQGGADTLQTIDNLIVATTFEEVIGDVPVFDADFNGDTVVNIADYTVWRDSLGSTGLTPFDLGDADGNGNVNAVDYDIWKSQFGPAGTLVGVVLPAKIPEPSSCMLASATLVGLALGCWRTSH